MKEFLSPQDVRDQMPFVNEYVYVDNGATTPTPKPVQDAMLEFLNDNPLPELDTNRDMTRRQVRRARRQFGGVGGALEHPELYAVARIAAGVADALVGAETQQVDPGREKAILERLVVQ